MEKVQGMTCNPKGGPKGPLTNIEDGLEQSVSDQTKERISNLLERIESLSDVEKLLLYLKLPTGSASDDVLRQTPTSFLYASNRLEQAQAFTWIRSHLEEDSQICVPKHEVYDEYRSYCESHGLKALCPADFGKVLKCIFPNVKPRRLGQRGQSRYCYSGLRKKFEIQPPSLPEVEISPKKPKTEDLQENELFSASCQLVCEWAGKLLSRGFSSLRELSEFLVGNLYVNSKSTAAFTVLAAMQEAGLHNSRVPVSPLFTCSSGGDKHRETQLQLQRKLQERELLKEQKKKLHQQRSEIEQEQMNSTSRGPSATPTKSPLPRSFSKTPTPIKSPVLRPPSSLALKSPGPVVTFRQTPTPTNSVQKPTKCVSRNITKLLQSPVHAEKPALLPQEIKLEVTDHIGAHPHSTAASATIPTVVSTMTSATLSPPLTSAMSRASIARMVEASKVSVSSDDRSAKPTFMVSSVNGMNLLSGGSHQFIISSSQGLIVDSEVFASSTDSSLFRNGMHVVQKPVVVSAGLGNNAQQTVTTTQLHTLPVSSIAGSTSSNLHGSVNSLSTSVSDLVSGTLNLSSSMGNISSSNSSASSFDSVHMGQSITIVSKPKEKCTEYASSGEIDSFTPSSSELERCRAENISFIPGNLSSRSAFVPVSNQKLAFTLIAPNLNMGVAMSESSSDESKDQEDPPMPMDQSETLNSSGGFEPQSDSKAEMSVLPTSLHMSDISSSSSSQSSLILPNPSPQYAGQKKVKNRFTPIRPKAPQTQPSQAQPSQGSFQKDQKTPEKDSRPVSALLKEKRAREAQEVLQHLASSFQTQAGSGKAFPSSLSLSAEVLGLSPDKGQGGSDVVIILTSPSAGGSKVIPSTRDLLMAEEKSLRDKAGSVALSMSDILIANPNFIQKKEFPSVATSHPQISVSYQPIARQLLTEKTKLTTADFTAEAATVFSQMKRQDSPAECIEAGNTTDEEVVQHMNNGNISGRLLLTESRGTDTPLSRKRKSSGQGNASQTYKRLNFATVNKKVDGEDDDVFIIDAPLEPHRHRFSRHILTGHTTHRQEVISPYHRPGSSTFTDMQVDEPVSRCQSTGVGTDEVTYSIAMVEVARQVRGKLNVESLESDALLDSGLAPPPSLSSKPVVNNSHSPNLVVAQSPGQKASVGTSAKNLVAAQQALLQEKELLDARCDSFLNKSRGQQNAEVPVCTVAGLSVTEDIVHTASKGYFSEDVQAAARAQARHDYSVRHLGRVHLVSQAEQLHSAGESAPSQLSGHLEQVHNNSQLVQDQPLSQSVYYQANSQTGQANSGCETGFSKFQNQTANTSKAGELCLSNLGNRNSQLQDASMNVDTFHMDASFLDLVHDMMSSHSQMTMMAGMSSSVLQSQEQQQKVSHSEPTALHTSSISSTTFSNPKHSVSSVQPESHVAGHLIHSVPAPTATVTVNRNSTSAKTHTSRSKLKTASSQQPPPNTLLALLQSPVLSAISPPSSSQSMKKASEKLPKLLSSQQDQGRPVHHQKGPCVPTISTSQQDQGRPAHHQKGPCVPATSQASSSPRQAVIDKISQPNPTVSDMISQLSPNVMPGAVNDKMSQLNVMSSAASDKMSQLNVMSSAASDKMSQFNVMSSAASDKMSQFNVMSSAAGDKMSQLNVMSSAASDKMSQLSPSVLSGGTMLQVGSGGASLSIVSSHADGCLLPDSTTTSLSPVPASLPANFLERSPQSELGGELPVDVADFVTDYSVRADLEQRQLQLQQQQLQLQGEAMRLEEFRNILLQQHNAVYLPACVTGSESSDLVVTCGNVQESSATSQKETFTMPSNPAPKQRLSDSGSVSAKKYPLVQRSASLPVFVPRGHANNPNVQEVPPSSTLSPTREQPTLSSSSTTSNIPARRIRQMMDRNSSQTPSDAGYHSFDTSPLMTVLTPLPPPVSTPTQEQLTIGLTSLKRNPMLSARSDSAQSVSSEGVVSLPQGSPQTSQGASSSNPGSVSACSPEDSAVASPSAFMPIQVSPSSSSSSVRSGPQQHYIQPIRPHVTLASINVSSHDASKVNVALISSSGAVTSTKAIGVLSADDNLELSQLSQMGVGVVFSDLPQGMSSMETSPASSVQSVKSEPGSAVSCLMSTSPCPGTVPYSAPSPCRHPAGVSPGPSPTPATSSACSPSSSTSGQRASASHGVLQKLLSTRSAPPSYAESVQQRLMASGQSAGNQVIGGFVDQRQVGINTTSAGNAQTGCSRARTNSAQTRNSSSHSGTGTILSGTSTELAGHFTLPMVSVEDAKPSARSVVHHVPSTTTSTVSTSSTSSSVERSGRRIAILKRDSNAKPKSSSSAAAKVASSASDSILKASLASPPSPLDSLEYSRPFSQKLLFLKQQMSQSEAEGIVTSPAKRQQAVPPTASAVLAASLASLKQASPGGPAESVTKVPPSPGGKSGGSASNLAVQVSSPATPGSVSSAPSPASQGQMSVPLRISTSTPSHSDIFFGLPASSPSPRVNPFSPQQPSSSSSSSSSSSISSSNVPLGSMYLPFNLPDMNYMGNAPNIDLSQLMPGKTAPGNTAGPSHGASDSSGNGSELQGLEELHLTLDILRGMDGHYFSGQDVDGEDLMHSVFGELSQESHSATAASSPDEEEEETGEGVESSVATPRSRVRESSL